MAVIINSLDTGSHGAAVTASSTAGTGLTQLTVAGSSTDPIAVTWDKAHHLTGDVSVRVDGTTVATPVRQLVLTDNSSPQSGVGSVVFMLAGLPSQTGHTVAQLATASSAIMNVTVDPAGTVAFKTGTGAVLKRTTTLLRPWVWYRVDMAFQIGAAGASLLAGQIITVRDQQQITDSAFTDTTQDLSAKVSNGVQAGKLTTGVTSPAWFDLIRFDSGTTTFPGQLVSQVDYATARSAAEVTVVSGTVAASGTRSGDTAPIDSSDLAGALGDGDTATVMQLTSGAQTRVWMGPMKVGGDVTVTPTAVTGTVKLQPVINGANAGAAKNSTGQAVTWTASELGNPASSARLELLVTAV